MVVAIGLLIPISYGLNGAQLLTLNVAKWGSAFATNGWVLFANTLTSSSVTITGQPASEMVATPRKPDAQPLISFFTIVGTCHRLYRDVAGVEIDAWLVRSSTGGATNAVRLLDTTWTQALAFYDNSNIMVVFGERSETRHNSEMGFVKPYCGKIVLPTVDLVQPGARSIQDSYYEQLIRRPWRNILHGTPAITTGVPNLPAPNNQPQDFFSNAVDRIAEMREGVNFPAARAPDQNALNAIRTRFESDITQYIQTAVTEQINNTGPWQAQLNALGWAGAGIWYNRIAELNGAMIEGISNLPTPAQMPIVMEEVSKAKMANSSNIPGPQLYEPRLTNGEAIQLPNGAQDLVIARVLWYAERVWGDDANPGSTSGTSAQRLSTKNALQDFVNFAFGTQGLYSMVENTNVHPLAQLVTLGKHLFNTALRNIAVSFGGSLAGFVEKNSPIPAEFITMITRAAGTFGNMTLVIGFVLYYIVPFMPFMYFFFQVGTWVKEVFEAMVGLPLWALAHLRIEEGGLPGPAGMNGYWLIFEIFLRPILLIFGLIGSIAIFAAQVQILNDIFSLVVMNVSGYNIADAQLAGPNTQGGFDRLLEYARSQIDTFFFTIMYAVIVYLLATSSFKLIYQVPNNILRWMGASVSAFEDSESSAPSSLISTTTMSLQTVTGNLSSLTSRFLMR
jgi:conjugal transfer/type IV secretion protein DotA/TraY